MNKNKAKILPALVLLLTSSGVGQQRPDSLSESQGLSTFTEVKGLPEYLPSGFEFSTSGYIYRISNDGRGRRTGGRDAPRLFNLRIDKDDSLERAMYAEHQGDILLVCEVVGGDSAAGFIARLDGRRLRMKWKRWIPAFNIGQGLIEGRHAYITAIGFIGKINLSTGVYVWRHDKLYRESAFNSFELPEIRGDTVIFRESESPYRQRVATIQVEKRSGRIIKLEI